jgi:hypothetical protein
MGWVQGELADKGDQVEGLVIAHSADDALRFALSATRSIRLMLYEVDFRLRENPT